jgi:hypothetical protein
MHYIILIDLIYSELKTSIMESTWKVIDGLVQPEQYLASINEQKVTKQNLNKSLLFAK